jgi:2-hydroxy-3-keto-5-methylthiopentenyl-1-phosphate phosphatase
MGFTQQQQPRQQPGVQQPQQHQQEPEVHANELKWGPDGTSTGQLLRQVQCGRDKLAALQAMLRRHQAAAAAGRVVYVGDSCSDILPLLEVGWVFVGLCWLLGWRAEHTHASVVVGKQQ